MLYCLFRHMASQVLRDVVVRAGERAIVRQLSSQALQSMLGSLGLTVTRAPRRHFGQPMGAARRRRRGRRVRLLGHAAGGEDGAQRAGDDAAVAGRRCAAGSPARRRATDDVRPLRTAQPSGGDRVGLRSRAPAGRAPALQHRADDGRPHRAGQCRGAARARAHALGPRSALGQGPVDRRADDQCARRDDRRQAVVPHVVSAAPLPAAGQRLLRVDDTGHRRRRAFRASSRCTSGWPTARCSASRDSTSAGAATTTTCSTPARS